MSQYRTGTVELTNGSPVVTAVDPDPGDPDISAPQQWLTNVSAGDLFIVQGDGLTYAVQSVDSDGQLTLTISYLGSTVAASGDPARGAVYGIVRDFSANFGFPLISMGDVETATIIKEALNSVDSELAAILALING